MTWRRVGELALTVWIWAALGLDAGHAQTGAGRGAPAEVTSGRAEPGTGQAGKATDRSGAADRPASELERAPPDYETMLFVFVLATFIGIGVVSRVSRLLHTPLMSLTNAISAIAVVGSIIVTGGADYPTDVRSLGAIALVASTTNIVSGFLITDRMLRMFKTPGGGEKR